MWATTKIFKVFRCADNRINANTFLVEVPADYDKDYLHYVTEAIQIITGDYGYCGTQRYEEQFDGEIPDSVKVWGYKELMREAGISG